MFALKKTTTTTVKIMYLKSVCHVICYLLNANTWTRINRTVRLCYFFVFYALKPFPVVCCKGWQGWPQGWTRIKTMLAQLSEVFFFNAMPTKITQNIVMGNASWSDLLDNFVISLTQKNICDLTLSLPESLMEFCNVTFEPADKILCCGHSNERSLPVLSQNAISFSKFRKRKFGNLVKICFC